MTNALSDFEKKVAGSNGDSNLLIPAATVSVLRNNAGALEVLMLRKSSHISFGGAWVFPGGRIDTADRGDSTDELLVARRAASREAQEEAGLRLPPEELLWMSRWTPPQMNIRRYETWFFAIKAPDSRVEIDDGEIVEFAWMAPAEMIRLHQAGSADLIPPTFVTLQYLSGFTSVEEALAAIAGGESYHYQTRVAPGEFGPCFIWQGDAGYESLKLDTPGARHRLMSTKNGFEFFSSL